MIEVEGLSKQYPDRWAVRDVSFVLRPGTVTGFVGLNGAGKSTTLRLMLGLEKGLGSTRFWGQSYEELDAPLRRVGALLDFETLHPRISGRKQLGWYARAGGLPDSRVDHVLEMVGMANDARRVPREYSLGIRQRMGMAAALLGDPDVLILDEPGNGMDPQGLRWIADLVQGYAETGRTVLMSSHSLADIGRVADQLIVIHQGMLISNGPTQEFVNRFAAAAVLVRSDNASVLAALLTRAGAVITRRHGDRIVVSGVTAEQIARLAAGAGVLLFELTIEQTTLEEAFVIASSNVGSDVARGTVMSVL